MSQDIPSKIALRLLRSFCPEQLYEELSGDLLQRYERDVNALGQKRAGWKLLWSTIKFFRAGILFRNKLSIKQMNLQIFANYIKTAFRNFARQKSYTFLNIIGLSLGFAASILIFQYVRYERSFDSFHSNADDIYRIQYNRYEAGKLNFESAVAVPAAGRALKENFPEVLEFTRLLPFDGVMTYETPGGDVISFHQEKMEYADSSFFKVFDFRLLQGDPRTALKGLNKVVITERAAKKYFGKEDAIGKRFVRNGGRLSASSMFSSFRVFEVTGVLADVPENSHIQFDFLVSYETLNKQTENRSETLWGWYDFYTFVLLKAGTDPQALQSKWDAYLLKTRGEEWDKGNYKQEFILKPLTQIHQYSHILYEAQPAQQRDGKAVYALGVIAIFILVIAWINYINLATARSFNRANEVGVRKVLGAFRGQLIGQFFTESLMLNMIAVLLALVIVRLSWPSFQALTGWGIPMSFISQPEFWWLIGALFLGGAFLSGFYPALVLSSFKPVSVLKGRIMRSSSGDALRKLMVVFQFVASVFLISGSIIVYLQHDFMKSRELGISIDQTLIVKGPGITDSIYHERSESFKNEILRIPGVKSMTASSNIPGYEIYWTDDLVRSTGGNQITATVSHASIDYDFVSAFGIKIVAGRTFDRNFPRDNKNIVINRAMAETFNFEKPVDAIGEKLFDGRDTVEIIGVLENYHQMSLKEKVAPIAFRLNQQDSFFAIKIGSTDNSNIISTVQNIWNISFVDSPFDYFFLDEFYNRQYDKDERFGKVFNLFTVLAIFIASMGLIGLASFMTLQRTKEVGIRKVLGSTVAGIVALLSKDFLKPVLIANVIALPMAWWLMDLWLQSFPYRININPLVFVISGFVVIAIAFISVSSQTMKAALTKPAETLKYE